MGCCMATRAEPGEWEQYSNSILLRRYLQKDGPRFIAAIQSADAGELSALLPMVARMISMPPIWLENHRTEAAKAFEVRLTTSPYFCQHVGFLLSCGFIPTPFFETKISNDAANFFQDIADQKDVQEGTIVEVNSDHPVYHPFVQTEIKKVQVKAVLASKTKPLLLNLYSGGKSGVPPLPQNMIFKAGDDLRQDMSCLQVFRLFNFFWRQRNLLYRRHPVQVHCYGCVPMASDKKNWMGCVEFVPGCVPISKLEELNNEKRIEGKILDRLIASAAGSYIACYLLGIRDRHYENILVQKDTGLLFHIDYGKVLGDKVTIDTSSIAITPDFYEVLGDTHYEQFVHVATQAFMVLRHYREPMHYFIYRFFSSFSTEVKVREFLVNALFLELDDLAAQERMKSKIMKAPASIKTRVKNAVHKVAVGIKKSGSSGRLSVGSPTNRKSTQTLSLRKESGVELLEGKKD